MAMAPLKEKVVEKILLQYINFNPNLFAWKYPTTGRYDTRALRWIKTAGTITGVADILVIGKTSKGVGFTAFIEVKAESGKQAKNQKEFQNTVAKYNGFYFLVKSIEDFNAALCVIEQRLS